MIFDDDSSNAIVVLFNQTYKSVTLVNPDVLSGAEAATLNLKRHLASLEMPQTVHYFLQAVQMLLP